MAILEKNKLLTDLVNIHIDNISSYEGLSKDEIFKLINSGETVFLCNPNHSNVKPILVGRNTKVKVNANIGTSPLECNPEIEFEKLKVAERVGADTVMDLSIGGDLDKIRLEMIKNTHLPIGTVPLYAVAKRYISNGCQPEDINMTDVFEEIEQQGRQGVDFMTIHTGIDLKGASYAEDNRLLGIVSRGGSMLARWMVKNNKENPLLENFGKILEIVKKYNITLSLGDGLRPGALKDAGDTAQWAEVINLGNQVKQARQYGVQCMVEGPGHVSLDLVEAQIRGIKQVTYNAPLYILGPLVIDNSPGYDHISGAIGAAMAVRAGADFLCYLTPAEHLTLPNIDDVRQGIIASRIAATAGEVANGRVKTIELQRKMSEARQKLDWDSMKKFAIDPEEVDKRRLSHKDKKECAMCGEFCSVKLQHNR